MALSLLLIDNTNNINNINLSRSLFKYFIIEGMRLYGDLLAVYNVHCLIHLPDDAKIHGTLDNISAFPFENYLQQIKKMVRGKKKSSNTSCK